MVLGRVKPIGRVRRCCHYRRFLAARGRSSLADEQGDRVAETAGASSNGDERWHGFALGVALVAIGTACGALSPSTAAAPYSAPQETDGGARSFVPRPPRLAPHSHLTNAASVTLRGRAEAGVSVEVLGPLETVVLPPSEGRFEVDVELSPDRVNAIYFTSISSRDVRSAPTVTHITHDGTPPDLFIDVPVDGAEVTVPTIDVAGRVGDFLSGFTGLSVTVNGIVAEVDVGIGPNGTFLATDVPLDPVGIPTTVSAIATDALGNFLTWAITVTQVDIPADEAVMSLVSGSGQSGLVNTLLAAPVVVHLSYADGSDLPNKVVTFDVSRSDGLLSPDGVVPGSYSLQVHTDTSGLAQVFWTLGSDAGRGNNRLAVAASGVSGTVSACASAFAGGATAIHVGSGDSQIAEVGTVCGQPLRVWVSDGQNPVSSIPVVFRVVEGGGLVDGDQSATVLTDSTGHAAAELRLGLERGNHVVEASFPGYTGLPATFTLIGLSRDLDAPTRFSGLVLDNSARALQGATITLTVGGIEYGPLVSGLEGQFEFDDIQGSGPAGLHVDGTTVFHVGGVSGEEVPTGSYPVLHYQALVVPGAVNSLPTPVFLPPLDASNAQVYDTTADVHLQLPAVTGLEMIVRAGTAVTHPNGSVVDVNNPITLAIHAVHFDEIPMPMPDGASPPFAWTLQPGGATFDPPVEVILPNMSSLPPGAIAYILSFDHDLEDFRIVSSAQVSSDGQVITSDPGSGIAKAGWGGSVPPFPDTGDVDADPTEDGDGPDHPDQEPPTKGSPPASPDSSGECSDGDDSGIDPVYFFSGEFYLDEEDLRIKGVGLDFVWTRKYRSKIGPDTAMGNGWDYSYNVFVEETGADRLVCDGNSRADTYRVQADGNWSRDGQFQVLSEELDGSYTMAFPSSGTWTFNPIDGSPAAGKITSIADRNSNTISFDYDVFGRLATITDTLGRDIDVHYDADGYIESIIENAIDLPGRQVRYDHYQDGDADGSFGDLKSVTSPSVTGTPTLNNFPDGKTTTYTYTTGFADEELNHNLLTITDPRLQTYLQNTYATTSDPSELDYDRIVRQVWGDPTDIIDLGLRRANP